MNYSSFNIVPTSKWKIHALVVARKVSVIFCSIALLKGSTEHALAVDFVRDFHPLTVCWKN